MYMYPYVLIAAPIANILCNKYGYRKVTMFGGLLLFVGFGLSAFAPNLEFLYFSYSILAGEYNTYI